MGFIHDDFLLSTEQARSLYHEHAAGQPIYDYHCHLPPADLAGNRTFANLHEAWLEGDHYKWRAMRASGVDEQLITGDADPYEKFLAWARSVPLTLRNPLYHWTHLELQRYFGIDLLLSGDTAQEIWNEASAQLQNKPVAAILKQFNVALVGTTDDPAEELAHHQAITRSQPFADTTVAPAFRPDKMFAVGDAKVWNEYVDNLAQVSGESCDDLDSLLAAYEQRCSFFHEQGGRLADHGLTHLPDVSCDAATAKTVFAKVRSGQDATPSEADQFTVFMMLELALLYAQRGWASQLHLGAMRNTSAWALKHLGPDTGFDSIGDERQGPGLVRFFSELAARQTVPNTVFYNLNPADNYLFATMVGNYQNAPSDQQGGRASMQLGSGWWFLDQEEAMRWQINALSNLGLLPKFVGMLTDSRSFMSNPRHEYFRRVLCDLLGSDMATGRLPNDITMIGKMVEAICFTNARDYFRIPLRGKWAH